MGTSAPEHVDDHRKLDRESFLWTMRGLIVHLQKHHIDDVYVSQQFRFALLHLDTIHDDAEMFTVLKFFFTKLAHFD